MTRPTHTQTSAETPMRPVFDADVLHADTGYEGDDRILTHVVRHNIFPGIDPAGGFINGDGRRELYTLGDARRAYGVETDTDAHAAVGYMDLLVRTSSDRFEEYCATVRGTGGA